MANNGHVAEPDARLPVVAGAISSIAANGEAWRIVAHGAMVGIALMLFWIVLYAARTLLIPIVLAIVIGIMFGPLMKRARRGHIPSWLAALALVCLLVATIAFAIMLFAAPAAEWIGKAPEIGAAVKAKLQVLEQPLAALRTLRNAVAGSQDTTTIKVDLDQSDIVAPTLALLTPAVGEMLLFIGTLFFFLAGGIEIRRYLIVFFARRDAQLRTLRILNDVERNLTRYLTIVTMVNLVVGAITAVGAHVIGFPDPMAFGVLAFVTNFVPYVGPAIMVVVLSAVSLATFSSLGYAIVAPMCYVMLTTLEGHFVTPSIMGRALMLRPLTVFLALAFWTWLWGPLGALLAVPLLIVGLVTANHLCPDDEAELPI